MCRFWSIGHSYLKVVHGYNEQNLCNSWCCLETNFRISSENIKRSLSYQCGQATRQYCITGQHINTQRTLFTVNMIFKPKWKCIQTIIEKDTNSVDSCCLQVSSISFKFFIPSLFLLWERRNEKLFFFQITAFDDILNTASQNTIHTTIHRSHKSILSNFTIY